jgi:hypothetical protein
MLKWKNLIFLLVIAIFLAPQISSAAFNLNLNQNGACGNTTIGGFSFSGCTPGGSSGWNIGDLMGYGLPSGSISGIIKNILSWILMIFGFLGLIGFVISGIMYIASAGDDTKMEKAKSAMTYSVIGIVVGLVGLVIIQAISIALNASGVF